MGLAPALPDSPHQALWARINSHCFSPDSRQNFAKRLARENRWTQNFANAAIEEYKRFCFLAATLPNPVTPSEEIDEVWHLHLLYSRDYWDIWCAKILQTKLHHDPTQGGPAEAAKFRAQYAETLAAYETVFGPPPATFWPATHIRFGATSRLQRFLSRWRQPA